MPYNKPGVILTPTGNLAVSTTSMILDLGGKLTYLEVLDGNIWVQPDGDTAVADATNCFKRTAGGYIMLCNSRIQVISDATGAHIQLIPYGDQ